MHGERSHLLAIGLLIGSLTGVVFGAVAIGSFASAPSDDLAVSAMPWTAYLLLTAGAVLLLGLEFAHARRRRQRRPGRPAPVREAARAWRP